MERHILVVEDQKDIADLIAMHLRDLGHQVDCVYDGGKGYDAGRTGRYDLIVLDVMLPVRDGLDVVRSLRIDRIDTPWVPKAPATAASTPGASVTSRFT